MDYTGGRFEGFQIRCQIISVPGQRELAARRAHLMRDADVVVFVADTTRERIDTTVQMLGEVPQLIAGAAAPSVGLILQANKRDLPSAVPLGELRERVRAAAGLVAVVESVAADGTGIRETFVFAVRLALDRVREQLRDQSLPVGAPEIDSGHALLAQIQTADVVPPPRLQAVAAPALLQVLEENDETHQIADFAPWREASSPVIGDSDGPRPPDPAAPSGAIWPPVEGRLILHEASAAPMTTHRLRNGAWAAGIGNGWRACSTGAAEYGDLDVGREMLVRWARLHVACSGILSSSRCVVLAATGSGTWRLWQIVRVEQSLRDYLEDIERCTTDEAAARILDAAALLSDMIARLQNAPCDVPCTLDTVGRSDRGAVYVGLMPMERTTGGNVTGSTDSLSTELESILQSVLWSRRTEVLEAIARSPRHARGPSGALIDQLLGAVG